MTYACGRGFSKYMERFFPVLETGLKQHQARTFSNVPFRSQAFL